MKKWLKKIAEKRKQKRKDKATRKKLFKLAAQKIEERRALAEDLRKAKHERKHKKDRDPRSEEREAELAKKIKALHEEIMALGVDLDKLDERIGDINGRRAKLQRRIKRAAQRIIRLETKAQAARRGPDRAVKAFKKDIGKTEQPPGSNWGPYVSKVIKFTGYSGPVYWCGCAACWWIVRKGRANIPTKIRLGYAGYIADDARHNRNGLTTVSSPVKAGLGTLWNYEHIVMTLGEVVAGYAKTGEGNTSSSDGSQSNGGGVFPKSRPLGDFDVFVKVVDWG